MQKSLIYIDILTGKQVTASGSPAMLDDIVVIERGQWQIICVQLVVCKTDANGNVTVTPATVASGSSLLLVGDNNFNDDDNLMFKSRQSTIPFDENDSDSNMFNIDGDWIGGYFTGDDWEVEGDSPNLEDYLNADPYWGQLSIRVNTDTLKFTEALNGKMQVTSGLYMYLKQYTAGIANPTTIGRIRFIAVNTIRDWASTQTNVPEGVTIVPFVDSYLRNKIELQMSTDGITWVSSIERPAYYRFRLANTSTVWSDPIPVLQGEPGVQGAAGADGSDGKDGTSAGFGEITSTTETVESTESASVTVTATGTDEAKNFTFDFKIPKGEKGNDGQSFSPDQTGTTEEKATYDDMPVGFSFLDITDGLLYFKQSDTSGDWSEGMPFGKGEKGDTGAAAGFATPEISVTTLEPGTAATATVTASGENTNKIFRFAFAIPRGEKGEPGEVTEDDKNELKADLKAYVQEELANGSW